MGQETSKVNFDISIIDPINVKFKFQKIETFNGENFLYFIPNKNFNYTDFKLEIFKKNIHALNDMQLHDININLNDFKDYVRDKKEMYEYSRNLGSGLIVFRYTKTLQLKELMYKVNSTDILY